MVHIPSVLLHPVRQSPQPVAGRSVGTDVCARETVAHVSRIPSGGDGGGGGGHAEWGEDVLLKEGSERGAVGEKEVREFGGEPALKEAQSWVGSARAEDGAMGGGV